ncbi:hypothetical protein PV10_07673 [Exophiala mesophila]|uniref:Uncharacterized protein n=1 Tax=Exophiala mesophila TaxID=212818 RepID=A0A0D1Z687_EXOME|nr:uncharacterized protein PV10_07673 [Exophiala mesophila]KIV90362.1 hypothetical protein PV10_07673 [Exophiala mesophila]
MTEHISIESSNSVVDTTFADEDLMFTSDSIFNGDFEYDFSQFDSSAGLPSFDTVAPVPQVDNQVDTALLAPESYTSDTQMLETLTAFLQENDNGEGVPSADNNMVYSEPYQPAAMSDLIPAPLFGASAASSPLFNGAVPVHGAPQYPPPGYSLMWCPAPLFSGPPRSLQNNGVTPEQYDTKLAPMPLYATPNQAYPLPAAVTQPVSSSSMPAPTFSLPDFNFNPVDFIDGTDASEPADVLKSFQPLSSLSAEYGSINPAAILSPAQEAEMVEKRKLKEKIRRMRAGLNPVPDPARQEEEERIMLAHDVAFYENRRLERRAKEERRRRRARQDRYRSASPGSSYDETLLTPVTSHPVVPVLVPNHLSLNYAAGFSAGASAAWLVLVPSTKKGRPAHRLPQGYQNLHGKYLRNGEERCRRGSKR